jgi:hypothetical protein
MELSVLCPSALAVSLIRQEAPPSGTPAPDSTLGEAGPNHDNRRRFVRVAVLATAAMAVPYSWVLFVLWRDGPSLLRTANSVGYASNIYDLQARALLSGHLYVSKGSLAIETWTRHGHDYTYFGVFPSLLRLPVLAVTHRFDGRLTALSLLLAWCVTAVIVWALIWRVRCMLRGPIALGRLEAASLGVVIASALGGSVLIYLAANPYVFSEDKAWGVALALGSLFSLLGMLERPSWGRLSLVTFFLLASNLTRITEGYAGVVGALLLAAWFALGRSGPAQRRWAPLTLGVALLAVALGSFINWVKFGLLFGVPYQDYRAFNLFDQARINGGSYFSLKYLPSTLLAYLQPVGLHFSRVFPFLTLPSGPPRAVAGVAFDSRLRTASLVTSMPLLFILSCWGAVQVWRPRVSRPERMLRWMVLAAGTGTAAVLFYGWIANRYLADFLPVLVLGAAIGVVDLWRRLASTSSLRRRAAFLLIAVVALFELVANIGIAISPTEGWTPTQATNFLTTARNVSNLTGHPLSSEILRGTTLPYWAPAGTLFVGNNCQGLYISNGEDYTGVLNQRAERRTWVVVEEGRGYAHDVRLDVQHRAASTPTTSTLIDFGQSRLLLKLLAISPKGYAVIRFELQDPAYHASSVAIPLKMGSSYGIAITTDQFAHVISVSVDDFPYLTSPSTAGGPGHLDFTGRSQVGDMSLVDVTRPPSNMALCRGLIAPG